MSSSENLNDCHLGRSIIRRGCLKSLTTLLTDFPKYLLVPFCMYSRKYGTGLCTETIDVKNYEGMECSIANFPLHPKLYQHIQLFDYFFDHEQRSKVLKEALFFFCSCSCWRGIKLRKCCKWNKKCSRTKFISKRTKNVPKGTKNIREQNSFVIKQKIFAMKIALN